jgi:N4-gp56 family major capsid protein
MADTSAATGLTVQQWDDKFFREYLGWNRFAKYMGTSTSSLIQVKEDLAKKKGDSVTFALVNRLTGAGITGSNTLEGNEEEMTSRSHKITVDQIRNAVRVPALEEQFSAIGLRNAGRDVLMDWAMEHVRDDVVEALGSINGVAFASATQAQRDAWLDDNYDRVLFGAAKSNTDSAGGTVAYDFSDSLAAVDNTADKLDTPMIDLAVRMAKEASPRIRPIRVREDGDEEWYVLFCNSRCFRDLKSDTALQQAQREALPRAQSNPLFTGGDLVWGGVIIREVPEIAAFTNGAIDVAPNFLCGAQALGYGIAKRWESVTEEFDYGDKYGVAVRHWYGMEKLRFGSGSTDTADLKDHGVFTIYAAAVADS